MNSLEQLIEARMIRDHSKSKFIISMMEQAHSLGKSEREQEIVEIIQQQIEQHEDKGDERYGYVKHFNTLLQRLEDDLLSHISSTNNNKEVWNYKNK